MRTISRRAVALLSCFVLGAAAAPTTASATTSLACSRKVAAAGDMNEFSYTRATGRLAQSVNPNVVTPLGDLQYPDGALADFREQYARTGWGALKPRSRPVPGNHEYHTPGAGGYFTYFGGIPRWYAYSLGCGWRGYALNSEVEVEAQARWLRADLAAHPGAMVLVTWHRPRWSSGVEHGSDRDTQPFWDALGSRRGVVLNGHEHNYERFAVRGSLRQFVVGTGGSSTYAFSSRPESGSVVRITRTPGVLVLSLRPGAYRWQFVAVGGRVRDSGGS